MEATAVSVGKAVLNGALSYAKSKAAEEIALQLGVERDVTFITDELQMMQSFLMTADEERGQNMVLTTWVKQVRDLAYNVEDSLMDFGLNSEKKAFLGCIPRNPCDRRRIAKEVKELRGKVEDVSSRNLRYRLIKEGSGSKPEAAAEQASTASAAMFGINEARLASVEQEKPKENLLQLITSDEVDLRVISVWGTNGGLGKTSAIQVVYDEPKVLKKFGFRAWIRLIHPFSPKEFLQSLVRQFYENSLDELGKAEEGSSVGANVLMKMEKMEQSDLVRVFNAQVSCNSYLIVIEDLNVIVEWHCIKKYFPDNKKRCRIIVSTQQVEIAALCTEQPYQVSELKQLSSDQTLYLFHKKVIPASGSSTLISDSNEVTTTEDKPTTSTIEIQEEDQQAMDYGGDKVSAQVMPTSGFAEPISESINLAMSTGEIQEEDQQPKDARGYKVSNSTARKNLVRIKTKALVDEVLTGRETEKSKVIKLVGQPDDNEGRKVISVWGMGGLGKTTLVRSVYRSQQLGGWKRAWAIALRPFNPELLLRDLALQLIKEDPTGATAIRTQKKEIATMKLHDLEGELTRHLKDEKCLIVLDDLSSTGEWDLVKNCLENSRRIIVTTREKIIAQHCSRDDKNMYNLSGLEDAAALDLFKKKVYMDNSGEIQLGPDMAEQAKLILRKCDGLPLAISAIGGFLATKPKTAIEWRKMNDTISAELDINPELRKISSVLMRSYEGLPYYLKSCFLYMSIFPEDHAIERKRLVGRWMAEGYSREIRGMIAEEVGGKYFDELLDRSMILPGEGVNNYSGKIGSCRLHDIIREICISKAREENLVFTLEERCCLSSTQGAIRHLVVSSNWKRDKDVLVSMLDLSHVRSLTVFGEWKSFFISDKMGFLRVLDLEDTVGLRDHHLDKIGQLIHLKYFSLRGCINIFRLPDSLGNLKHLQTLDARGTQLVDFPTAITRLQNLQYLRAGYIKGTKEDVDISVEFDDLMGGTRDDERPYFLARCSCALCFSCANCSLPNKQDDQADGYSPATNKHRCRRSCLPCIFHHLLSPSRICFGRSCLMLSMGPSFLRPQLLEVGLNRHDIFNLYRFFAASLVEAGSVYVLLDGVEAPIGIGKLKSLHTVGVVNIARGKGKATPTLKALGELTQLRKLSVAGINNKNSEKFWSVIAGHNQLRSLSVSGDVLDSCLGGNLSLPEHLESLKLEGKLVKVTEWIHQLQNLSKLVLRRTNLKQDADIQAVGSLPGLAVLRLRYYSFVGDQLLFRGWSFPSLMVLEFRDTYPVKSMLFEQHTMRKLELLEANSWLMEEISGLQYLTGLKEIRLGDSNSREMNEEVQRQVAKHVSVKRM